MSPALTLVHFGGGVRPAIPGSEVIGSKAAGLLSMAEAGLPVPPGFVLGTDWCRRFMTNGSRLPVEIDETLDTAVRELERATGARLGNRRRPLLVAVRSGAAVSMPGMMDTVLNVGLNEEALRGLIRSTGQPHFAWDSYRRLIQAYGEIVRQLPATSFDEILSAELQRNGVPTESELDVAALRSISAACLGRFEAGGGESFPQDPRVQLREAIAAVFRSWESSPAKSYRRMHGLDDTAGTAVTVQAMVFGNMGLTSGSGVGFTRDPATGEDRLYLDFLPDAQGEDVVSGRRTAQGADQLLRRLPVVHAELERVRHQLEGMFGDAQDFEFTVQEGSLYLLQTRSAKRTSWAALRIAVDLAEAGIISRSTALERMSHIDLEVISRPELAAEAPPLARGTPAGPGVAAGRLALDSSATERLGAAVQPVILVRRDTSTADIDGLSRAAGILTAVGSRTSHAAVVARQLDKVCIVGCTALAFDPARRRVRIGERWFDEGDTITLDGSDGRIYGESVPVVQHRPEDLLAIIHSWRNEGRPSPGRESEERTQRAETLCPTS